MCYFAKLCLSKEQEEEKLILPPSDKESSIYSDDAISQKIKRLAYRIDLLSNSDGCFVCKKMYTENYYLREVYAHLTLIDHPNVATLLYHKEKRNASGAFIEGIIYLEYCDEELKPQNVTQFKSYLKQLISCVMYCHSKNIVHRDIKPTNIVCSKGIIKLIDFELSTDLNPNDKLCGTPNYTAPEIVKLWNRESKELLDEKVDIWAIGVLIYVVLYGVGPFQTDDVILTYKKD